MPPREPSPATLASPWRRYVLATRPAFLSVAVVAALLGSAYTPYSGGSIHLLLAVAVLAGAVLVQAGINVLNDYYDALNGTDANNVERLYPFTGGSRFIQNGIFTARQTRRYGVSLLAAAMILGAFLCARSGWSLALLGAAGIFVGWAYSAPPCRLNSRGLGEVCVALGFGVLIPLGADLVQQQELHGQLVLMASPFALLVTNILYINQFPDHRADAAAGKHHWVVRLGPRRARWVYLAGATAALGLACLLVLSGRLPTSGWIAVVPILGALWAAALLLRDWQYPHRLMTAIKLTIFAALAHGITLAAVLALGP